MSNAYSEKGYCRILTPKKLSVSTVIYSNTWLHTYTYIDIVLRCVLVFKQYMSCKHVPDMHEQHLDQSTIIVCLILRLGTNRRTCDKLLYMYSLNTSSPTKRANTHISGLYCTYMHICIYIAGLGLLGWSAHEYDRRVAAALVQEAAAAQGSKAGCRPCPRPR